MRADLTAVAVRVCTEWLELGRDDMAALFTDDAVYRNMPFRGEVVGGPAIAAALDAGRDRIRAAEVSVVNVVAAGDVVVVERVETIQPAVGETIVLPVVGVLELRDGRVAAWRDYFDGALLRPLMS